MSLLKDLRTRAGMTLRQVEEVTNISNAYLSQLESGKIKKPSAQTLYVLAKLYCTDVESLLVDTGLVKEISVKPANMEPSIKDRMDALEKAFKEYQKSGIGKAPDFFHPDTKFS